MNCYKHPRPAVTTDALVFGYNRRTDTIEVLLIKRKNPPFEGMFALPGGFVEMNETLEECAARELAEETELLGVPLIQMRAFSKVDRDPRGRTISVVFFGLIDSTTARVDGRDDAAKAEWVNLLELPKLAFDHNEIVDYAVKFAFRNIRTEVDKYPDCEFSRFKDLIEYVGRKKLLEILGQYGHFE